ncbi:Sensor protein EvgS precursor [Novipirellula aureliae]|uniref:histidine kinase n=1 Tax=Novipirellula aureliae TaxID=2527966 RepID=A0A5C6DYI8_9BACT|nr:HAMP domain-containing sensor histidine kinase [Novipirellula aureliae]TWU41505.1 Sensor protein EvgS precursor [Novipirellula aureliae]
MITPRSRSKTNKFSLLRSGRTVRRGVERVSPSVSLPHGQSAVATPAVATPAENTRLDAVKSEPSGIEQSVREMIQMLSETAHDLRSPLTTIRESVRLVHDGEVGSVSEEQRSFLESAIHQCDCIDQMVGEMLHLDRLRTGLPRTHRRWIPVSSIRDSVQDTMAPWTMPRNIAVLWDGADEPSRMVYADPAILRRLLVNLIVNAIRVTRENEEVLVRVSPAENGEALHWSVIDQGAGISQAQMKRMETEQFASTSGEGLGLAISRQLAALHFSRLRLRSRVGYGTEVSFQTPTSGPRSVAKCWIRWRQQIGAQQAAHANQESLSRSRIQRRVRLDPPLLSVELSQQGNSPRFANRVSLGTVSLGAAMSRPDADEFDQMLQKELRLFELAYRVDTRAWVCVMDADNETLANRMQNISDTAEQTISAVRLKWSDASVMGIDHPMAAAKLTDLLVRKTLSSTSQTTIANNDQVRLGTAPIESSNAASVRLDQELKRLSAQLRRQSKTFKTQAAALRPTP